MEARKGGEAKWVSSNEPLGSRLHKSKQQLGNQLTRKNRQSEQMLYALYTFYTYIIYRFTHVYICVCTSHAQIPYGNFQSKIQNFRKTFRGCHNMVSMLPMSSPITPPAHTDLCLVHQGFNVITSMAIDTLLFHHLNLDFPFFSVLIMLLAQNIPQLS